MTQSNATPGQAQTPPPPQAAPLNYAPPGYSGPPATPDDMTISKLMFIWALVPVSLGPTMIWILKKDAQPYVDHQGKEIINWQITVSLAYIVAAITMAIFIGFILVPAVIICHLIFNILGILKAGRGEQYRYPFALRFLK